MEIRLQDQERNYFFACSYINGPMYIPFEPEGWIFIKTWCSKKGNPAHGPFSSKCKHLKICSNLDCNEVRLLGNKEVIQFITGENFVLFDSLFGK